jgi:hypothetical protein
MVSARTADPTSILPATEKVPRTLYMHTRARALWGLTRNLRKPRNTAKCLPTPSLHFCYPGATGLRFRPSGHSAVKPAAPLSRHHSHDARGSGSGLGAAPRSEFPLQRQPSVRETALEHLATPTPFSTDYFRACTSGSRVADNSVHQLSLMISPVRSPKSCKTP